MELDLYDGIEPLTEEELQVLALIAQGEPIKKIAHKLGKPYKRIDHMLSIEEGRNSILHKLNLNTREQAVGWYYQRSIKRRYYEEILEYYHREVSRIYQTRVFAGLPKLVFPWTIETLSSLKNLLNQDLPFWFAKELARIATRVLIELSTIYAETSHRSEILLKIQHVLDDLFNLAKKYGEREFEGYYYLHKGNAHYIARDASTSIKSMIKAEEYVKDGSIKDENLQTAIYRISALDWAFLGETKESEKAQQKGLFILKEGKNWSLEYSTQIMEGFARAQAILGSRKAFDLLDEGQQLLDRLKEEGQNTPIREVMLKKAYVESLSLLDAQEKSLIKQIATEGLAQAQAHGYSRYIDFFGDYATEK
jgi:hypothetical protein